MADVSITATTRRAQFTGNTGLGPFAFTFNVLDETDLAVIKNSTELVPATDYTATVNADGTGSVTLTGSGNGTALISSDVLTILGDRPLSRTSDYTQGGNLFASAINEDLDSLVIGLQQVDEKIDRSFRIQPGDEFIDLTLPLRADRANNYLAFNADGDPVVVSGTTSTLVVTAFAETLLDDTNAPAMLNTLGLSATAAEINLLDGVTWTLTDYNALTSTAAELNILDGDTSATATTLVDADRVVVNDAGTMVQVAMSDVSTYTFGSLSIDEDDMSSDSATKLPTQQSVKAYVDTQVGIVNIVTKTASASASLEFTEFDATLYRGYKFEIFGLLPGTDGHDIFVQFSTDGGSNWITTTDYAWASAGGLTNGAAFDFGSNSDVGVRVGVSVGSAAGEPGLSASLTLYEPDASAYTTLGGTGFSYRSNGDKNSFTVHGSLESASAVNAVRFIAIGFVTGTLDSGTITMQGITR